MPRKTTSSTSICSTIILTRRDLNDLPGLPRNAAGPTFAEPWQAQAFALTLALHERGVFTWPEWAEALSAEIARAQAAGDPDLGDTYYDHWLGALEKLVAAKNVVPDADLRRRQDAWEKAARETRHGDPILLPAEERARARG